MKFVVVNDIHANSVALKEFMVGLRNINFDKLIFLGDALTYGVDVKETIDLLHRLEEKYDCVFIKGNHEQTYFDYQNNENYQYKRFPNFLLESILHSAEQLSFILEDEFEWVNSFCYEGVIFSHANLFDYSNWSYLNTETDFQSNYNIVVSSKLRGAIFGHTHRAKYKKYKGGVVDSNILELPVNQTLSFSSNDIFLVTNGSLGQPRGSISSFLICDINSTEVVITSIPLSYNIALHCQSITESSLTASTKEKLLKYYDKVLP